jgi:hypothetical protein
MTTVTIDGYDYIMVRAINSGCEDCVARDSGDRRCDQLKKHAPENKNFWCRDVVWIEDTEAARLAYITLKLEN